MSEEDETFERLRVMPGKNLINIINSLPGDEWYYLCQDAGARERFLNRYGWTYKDWLEWVLQN